MILNFIAQNRIHFKTRKKRVFPGFFSQLPETRVLKFCPELETLATGHVGLLTRGFKNYMPYAVSHFSHVYFRC